jgi:hypothetical protein
MLRTVALICGTIVMTNIRGQCAILSELRTVTVTGRPAPGTAMASFSQLGVPAINSAGQVSFDGIVQGTGVNSSNDEGLWTEKASVLGLAVREGTLPGPNARSLFSGFRPPFNLSNGEVAFTGRTTNSVAAPFLTTASGVQQLSGPGFPVPDSTGAPLPSHVWVSAGVSGALSPNALLFEGTVQLPNTNVVNGYWSDISGDLRLIAKQDDHPPGSLLNATFAFIRAPVMNISGQIAFEGDVSTSGFGVGVNTGGIWVKRNTDLQLLAGSGSAAPEVGFGVTYAGFQRRGPSINKDGQLLYHAYFQGPGITTGVNEQALVVDDGVARRIVVQRGQSVVAAGTSFVFDRLDLGDAVINDIGQIVFSGRTRKQDNSIQDGIWEVNTDGTIRAIALEGDPAPGGGTFPIRSQQPFALNSRGQIAFASDPNDNNNSLWATDQFGNLQLIASVGNQIELAPGDVRTVDFIEFLHREFDDESSALNDGIRSGFSNLGHVAFRAHFQDGSWGIFVSSAVAVPEPTVSASMIVVVGLASLYRARSVQNTSRALNSRVAWVAEQCRNSF